MDLKIYETDKIRNVALVGHSGSGKTNLVESMLFQSGSTSNMGNVSAKNTVSDFSDEEIKRQTSIGASVIPIEWRNHKINIVDAPGYLDYVGEVYSALRSCESAIIVIDATAGIQVGTELLWKYCEEIDLPRVIFVNKIDGENVNFRSLMEEIEEKFGKKIVPFSTPIGEGEDFKGVTDVIYQKGYHYKNSVPEEISLNHDQFKATERIYEEITEVVAESDEELMNKYFDGETFTREELVKGVTLSLISGDAVPLLVGSGEKAIGIDILLNMITNFMPAPNHEMAHIGFRPEDGSEIKVNKNEPTSAVIFKTIADPFVGKISIFKVISGSIKKGDELFNITKGEDTKFSSIGIARGKKIEPVDEIVAGDIGAATKLGSAQTGDSFGTKEYKRTYKKLKYPKANLFFAIEPAKKGDEEKILTSLYKLQEEDPSFEIKRDEETSQLTIGGLGSVQLQVIIEKLKNLYGVDVNIVPFIVPYRETITKKVEVQGKHKKQSGGAGQYGDVWIRFEPSTEEFEFAEEIFGGSVPKNYFPAIEKGLDEARHHGPLAGFPLVNFKATLYDGSYHDVDSNEMSFKLASQLAYRNGTLEAGPVLLEPIMKVEITIPESYLGDIMGDINKRRGRILGMDQQPDGSEVLFVEAPLSELFEYSIDLRAMTQGRGNFSMEFGRYEQVPKEIADKIIEEKNKENN